MQQIRLFFQSIIVSLVPKSVDFRKYQTGKTDKVNSFYNKEKWIPGMVDFKAKYMKRRWGHGCNFIKKDNWSNRGIWQESVPGL